MKTLWREDVVFRIQHGYVIYYLFIKVLGVVVYSGHDTKIMMNSIKGKMKYSKVEKAMNK
jgi:hypothetical protein